MIEPGKSQRRIAIGLFEFLGRRRWLHQLVATTRLYPMARFVLRRYPWKRRLNRGELIYRLTSLDQVSIAYGMFALDEYSPALGLRPVETFIDLGCNAGWFVLWLVARNEHSPVRGLLVDANPMMAAEATWHMKRNSLLNCVVVHGAVGMPLGQSSATFHLHPSSSASSVLPYVSESQFPAKGRIVDLTVPTVSVAHEWQRYFGGAAVDLVKIDIEGKELDLVVHEGAFLRERVRRIVVEWHKWYVTLADLDAHLASLRFARQVVHSENDRSGLAVYERLDEIS